MRNIEDRKGGGLMIMWKKSCQITIRKVENTHPDIMITECSIEQASFIIILVYMSVNDRERNDQLSKEIDNGIIKYQNREREIVLLGDFNGHVGYLGKHTTNKNGDRVLQLMERHNMILLNDDPDCKGLITWQQGEKESVIDFCLMNEKMYKRYIRMNIDDQREIINTSDHNLMTITIRITRKSNTGRIKEEQKEVMRMSESNKIKFTHKVKQQINQSNEVTEINTLNNIIKEVADNTLMVTINRKITDEDKKLEPIWISKDIKKQISKRREINKRRRRETNQEECNRLWVEYEKQKAFVNKLVMKAVEGHEMMVTRKIMEDKNRGKKLWQNIELLRGNHETSEKKIKIYDENGVQLEENNIENELKEKWTPVYQCRPNRISEQWSMEEAQEYQDALNERMVQHTYQTGWSYSQQQGRIVREQETITFPEHILEHMEMAFPIRHTYRMTDPQITTNEVKKQLIGMKNGKATGPDGLKIELYKCLSEDEEVLQTLTHTLNEILRHREVPEQWKRSKTIMIEKKVKPTIRDFRPIALTNASYKIFMGLIKDKIEKHIAENKLVNEYQAGATRGRRAADNLFMLNYCIEESYTDKKSLFIISIDYSKAFDSLDRGKIIEVLKEYKIHESVIDVIAKIYQGDSTDIYINRKMYTKMEITSGIRQGCNASALLFVLVTYKIIEHLKDLNKGFRKGNIEVPVLYYIDDGLIITNSIKDTELIIKEIEEKSSEYGLKLNKEKCSILVINKREELENIKGIKVNDEIKYLGVMIGKNRDCYKKQREISIQKANRMTNCMYSIMGNACNRMLIGKTFWKGMAMPGFLYAQEVLMFNETEIQQLQRADNKAFRTILQVPTYTATEFLRGEVGASSARARDMKTKILYVKHALKEENNAVLKTIMYETLTTNRNKWARRVNAYMEEVGIDVEFIKNNSINEIKKKINDHDTTIWKDQMETKTTLSVYRSNKQTISEEKWYRNGERFMLMMRARSDTLNLAWRNWGVDEAKTCKLCGAEDETLKHFIIRCDRLQEIRKGFLLLQRPNIENEDEIISEFLFMGENIEQNRNEHLVQLQTLWTVRKKIIKQLEDNG